MMHGMTRNDVDLLVATVAWAQAGAFSLTQVKAANVDVVFYGGYYSDAGRLKKQLSDAGVDAKFVSGDGSLDNGFVTASGAAGGEGALLTCPCKWATESAPGKLGAFAKKYKAEIKKDPGTYSTEGYDAVKMLVAAVEEGKTTRAQLLEYVESLDSYEGIGKTIEFEANGNVKGGDVFVYEVKAGKITELGTTEELAK